VGSNGISGKYPFFGSTFLVELDRAFPLIGLMSLGKASRPMTLVIPVETPVVFAVSQFAFI
jgi:hypothetical protein